MEDAITIIKGLWSESRFGPGAQDQAVMPAEEVIPAVRSAPIGR